jgi:hypothetical protein
VFSLGTAELTALATLLTAAAVITSAFIAWKMLQLAKHAGESEERWSKASMFTEFVKSRGVLRTRTNRLIIDVSLLARGDGDPEMIEDELREWLANDDVRGVAPGAVRRLMSATTWDFFRRARHTVADGYDESEISELRELSRPLVRELITVVNQYLNLDREAFTEWLGRGPVAWEEEEEKEEKEKEATEPKDTGIESEPSQQNVRTD